MILAFESMGREPECNSGDQQCEVQLRAPSADLWLRTPPAELGLRAPREGVYER